MSISLTPENKNTLTITNDSKGPQPTWAEATNDWDSAIGSWDVPGEVLTLDTKNTLTITNNPKT